MNRLILDRDGKIIVCEKMLDTADIVRDASFRHSESGSAFFPKNGPNSRKYRGTNNTK